MCGVIGYYSDSPQAWHLNVVRKLFEQSDIRGKHAFGVTWMDAGRIGGVQRSLTLESLVPGLATLRSTTILGHARYSTSGDWKTKENNQPLVIGGTALVFNGVIDMRTKEEMERDYGPMHTANDGELFIKALLEGVKATEFISARNCSFAGCYIIGGRAYCVRNKRRPLWYAIHDGATYVMSTRHIGELCGLKPTELPDCEEFPLDRLSQLLPCATVSQQAGRLYSVPPGYAESRRYGPRAASDDVSGKPPGIQL